MDTKKKKTTDDDVTKLKRQLAGYKTALANKKNAIDELNKTISSKKDEISILKTKNIKFSQDYSSIAEKNAKLRRELGILQERIDNFNSLPFFKRLFKKV